MCSILVYQADRIIIDNEQERFWKCPRSRVNSEMDGPKTEPWKPEYTSFEFLSDVGGTAGLVLGLSAASLISIGEDLFRVIYEKCRFK